jgi:hypothetical protein
MPDAWPLELEALVTAEEELYSRVPVAGHDDRYELEARIRFGKADVLRPDQATLDGFALQVDRDRWDYSYVFFPFDLQPQHTGYYESVRVTTTFRHPDILAKYLSPSQDNTFVPFEGRATTWGLGMPEMSWQLQPAAGSDQLRPQGHTVMCLLQRPKTPTVVEVVIAVTTTIVRTTMVFERRVAANRAPGHYRISFAEGTFERLPV